MRKSTTVFLTLLLLVVTVLDVMPAIKSQPTAPGIWIEPETLDFNATTTHIGDKFNVTVWASTVIDVFAYQVKISYGPTMLNVTSVSYTASSGSAWFAGHFTFAALPEVDYVDGWVVVGETLVGSGDAVHASSGSICLITFEIIAAPASGETLTSLIDTSQPDASTYLLDENMNVLPNVALDYSLYTFSNGGAPPPAFRHDVVVSSVALSSQIVNWGDILRLWVTTLNNGTIRETFDANVTINGTLIGEQTVDSLAAGSTQILIFEWNTSGVKLGNYAVTATVTPVAGQTDLNDISKTVEVQVVFPQSQPPNYNYGRGYLALVNPDDGSSVIEFTSAQKSVGGTFVVNLTISYVINLSGWQATIYWDTSLLSFVGINAPSDNVFAGQTVIETGPNNPTPGSVTYGLALPNSKSGYGAGFNGTGTLAQLTLRIIQAVAPTGQRVGCDIGYRNIEVNDTLGYGYGTSGFVHFSYSSPVGPGTPLHDVAVTNVAPQGTSVAQGFNLAVSVTVADNGAFPESFNVTIYGNSTIPLAPGQPVTNLGWGENRTLTFVWNTTGAVKGNYILTATVDTVPGETNTADNTMGAGVIYVVSVGAVTGSSTAMFTDPSMVQSTVIGENFIVSLEVSDVVRLFAWQANFTLDPNIFECTGFFEGEFLRRPGGLTFFGCVGANLPSTFATSGANLTDLPDGPYTPGSVLAGGVAVSGVVSGSGQLAYATFTTVGIGVSDLHLNGAMLWGGNNGLESIPFKTMESFTVPVNGTNYRVQIADNLTGLVETTSSPTGVFNPSFNMQNKTLSFQAVAVENWFCQVAIPKELLSCDTLSEWTVKMDGTPIPYNATESTASTVLYFTNAGGQHAVEVIGRNVAGANSGPQSNPQNPSGPEHPDPPTLLVLMAASLCLITLMVALVDLRKTRSFKLPDEPDNETPS